MRLYLRIFSLKRKFLTRYELMKWEKSSVSSTTLMYNTVVNSHQKVQQWMKEKGHSSEASSNLAEKIFDRKSLKTVLSSLVTCSVLTLVVIPLSNSIYYRPSFFPNSTYSMICPDVLWSSHVENLSAYGSHIFIHL